MSKGSKAQLSINGYALTFLPGDFASLASLFFDNLSTLLGVSGATFGVLSADPELARKIVYQRMVPSCGVMLFLGNVYYAFQSARMTKQKGRLFTAQPYGLNTSGAFPFIFNIMLPIALGAICDVPADKRVEVAYQVCVAANFLTGIINIVLGIVGEYVLYLAPIAAFLTPISGIGIVWLAINQIIPNLSAPFPGLLPLFMCFYAYYSGCFRRSNGEAWLPEALQMVIPALIIAYIWQSPVFSPDAVELEVENHEAGGLYFAGGDIAEGFKHMSTYVGVVIPISLLASMGDIMVLVSAQKAGDAYSIRETMISDGVGTLLGALLGSPIGTVVYIGHPIHKKNGAGNGYSLMNGVLYLIITLSGLMPIIAAVVPLTATGPIIMIFGLMITQQAFESVKPRHWPAIVFGLFFFILDYAGAGQQPAYDGSEESEMANYASGFYGKTALRQSAPLLSIMWCSMITYTIDRRWDRVIFWACLAAVCSALGIVHQPKALVSSSLFANGVFAVEESCVPDTSGMSEEAMEGYGPSSPMWFMMAYFSIAAVCGATWMMNRAGFKETFPDPIFEDGVDDVFQNWEGVEPPAVVNEKPVDVVDSTAAKSVEERKVDEVPAVANDTTQITQVE
jgi:AGZA family xanthine/uracil permease-like MFS transporter